MAGLVLTREEVREVTGCAQRALQRQHLDALGIPYGVNAETPRPWSGRCRITSGPGLSTQSCGVDQSSSLPSICPSATAATYCASSPIR